MKSQSCLLIFNGQATPEVFYESLSRTNGHNITSQSNMVTLSWISLCLDGISSLLLQFPL